MHDWQTKFSELRNQFLRRSVERLQALTALIDNLPYRPSDTALLKDVRQHFHWFAGSGGVYGFEVTTKLGQHGEEICDFLMRDKIPASKVDCEKMHRIVQLIRQSLSGAEPADSMTESGKYALISNDKFNLLLVDNNSSSLGSVVRLMEAAGLRVQHAMTSKSANEAIMQRMPDALLISIPLVDCQGYELAQLVRSMPGGDRIPIIIVSQQAAFLDKVQAIRSGADAFFDYPLDEKEIYEKIKHLLDRDKPEKYRVMSVEDDPDQAAFIKLTLESAGYSVLSLQNPTQFEEAFLRFEPDLLLLDVMLGSISGFELAQYVRQKDRYATLPVLFLTTENALEMHIRSARVGSDDHLVKPIAPQLLAAAVAGRIEKSRTLRRLIERDGLTHCFNHGTFMDKATRIVEPDSHRFSLTLLLLDVDAMHDINEQFGYAVGDKVLGTIGPLLQKNFRNASLIGRVSGDRFAIILENLEDYQVERLTKEIIQEFSNIMQYAQNGTFRASLSAGLASHDYKMDLRQWFSKAEQSLKEAKESGGNQIIIRSQAPGWGSQ